MKSVCVTATTMSAPPSRSAFVCSRTAAISSRNFRSPGDDISGVAASVTPKMPTFTGPSSTMARSLWSGSTEPSAARRLAAKVGYFAALVSLA